ncbi:MAG: hypothetical protein WCJ19_03835 [bacterium]
MNSVNINNLNSKPIQGTIKEYIEIILCDTGDLSKNDSRINQALNILNELVPEILKKQATDYNIAVFWLTLNKKNKKVAKYYKTLLSPKLDVIEKNNGNVSETIDNLLSKTSIKIHSDNEIDKYYLDTDYSFSCNLLLEDYKKFFPDKSIQDLLQQTIRLRVAYIMTLAQINSKDFGILREIFVSSKIYSRELILCVLYHIISTNYIETDKEKKVFEKYHLVNNKVFRDLKNNCLQLPERRLFKIKNEVKKGILNDEFKNFIANEKDFSQNNMLKIITIYENNLKLLSDKIFPVVAIKDPITGSFLNVKLVDHGVKNEEFEEVFIPHLNVITDRDLEKYIKKQIARKLADNPHQSIQKIIEEVLLSEKLGFEGNSKSILNLVRPYVYQKSPFGRKLLFWMDNYDNERTVLGNLTSTFISKTMLPSAWKEKIEKSFNITGLEIYATVGGLAFGGLPAAVVLGLTSFGITYVIKEYSPEKLYARGYLKGIFGSSKSDLKVFGFNVSNPYFDLFRLMMSDNNIIQKGLSDIIRKTDLRPDIIKKLNNIGIKVNNTFKYSIDLTKDFLLAIAGRAGASNKFIDVLRRTRESIENIKTMSQSGYYRNSKNEALFILTTISTKSFIFGYRRSILAKNILKDINGGSKKRSLLSGLFFPKYKIDNSGLYSYAGRTFQRTAFRAGQGLGIWGRKDGLALVNRSMIMVGAMTARFNELASNISVGNLNKKATSGLIAITTTFATVGAIMGIMNSPMYAVTKFAYTPGVGGDGVPQFIVNTPIPGNNGEQGCPLTGPLQCFQGPKGQWSHLGLVDSNGNWTKSIDLTASGPKKLEVYAISDGSLRISGESCKYNSDKAGYIVTLVGTDGNNYEYFHMDYSTVVNKDVKKGDFIGNLFTLPQGMKVGRCWTGLHLHIQVYSNTTKNYLNSEIETIDNQKWNCNLSKQSYLGGAIFDYCEDGNYFGN